MAPYSRRELGFVREVGQKQLAERGTPAESPQACHDPVLLL